MKTYLKLLLLCALFYSIGQPRAVAAELTIFSNGSATNGYVPFWTEYQKSSSNRTTQMIYSSSLVTIPQGSTIKSITFYAKSSISKNIASTTISLGETSELSVTNDHLKNRNFDVTNVYTGLPTYSSDRKEVTYTFTSTYKWNGGNLVIQTFASSAGGDEFISNVLWEGESQGSSGAYRLTAKNADDYKINTFLPKIKIVYETSDNIPTATINPSSLNFEDIEAGKTATANLSITNTSSNGLSIIPTLTLTGNSAFTVNTSELPEVLASGESVVVPVTYSPTTADKTHTAELKLTYVTPGDNPVAGTPVTVSLTGNSVVPSLAATATPAEGTINFGKVIVGGTPARFVIKKAGITNVGTEGWNIPTSNIVTTGDNAFAIVPNQDNTQVDPNDDLSFTITFTPTEAKAYEGTLSVTPYEGRTITWFLMGEGSDAQATMFDNKTYAWPFNADASKQTTSYMSEIATDPDQMIALCRAVYMDTDIPGNYTRGYTSDGKRDDDVSVRGQKGAVSYPAIGKINYNTSSGIYQNEPYKDSYGWNIPAKNPLVVDGIHTYFDPTEYKPKEEGVTLLMVEMKDGALPSTYTTEPSSYETLRALFAAMFKSVRVVKDFKKVGTNGGTDEGTLFKIDADKLNRFFFLAKGRLRHGEQQYGSEPYGTCIEPNFLSSTNSYSYTDSHGQKPFYNMFEELSPVSLDGSSSVTDAYQALVNMQSYTIEHDCNTVPYMTSTSVDGVTPGHEFNMYGPTSTSDDCQDVHDLMFLMPERRMTWYSNRDGGASTEKSGDDYVYTGDMYKNYYKAYAPTLGLFAIVQEPITGVKKDGEDTYKLTLTWHSNLLNYLPSGDGQYHIYQVVNNNGVETYEPVLDTDGNPVTITATKTSDQNEVYQYVEIPMLEHGQQVTFVIQAVDNSGFLTMQMSNKQSFIIPGTNPAEMLQLTLTETNSRFDPEREKNYYSNGLQVVAYENQLLSTYLSSTATQPQFTIWRTARTPQRDEDGNFDLDDNGNMKYDEVETQIGSASVGADNTIAITIDGDQTASTDFPTGESNDTPIPAGYKTFTGSTTYKEEKGYVVLKDFKFFDNFHASTATNMHPTEYVYQVKLTTAEPFSFLGESSNEVKSNTAHIYIPKTNMEMGGVMTLAQVNADTDHSVKLPEGKEFTVDVKYASRAEVLRYDVYRWNMAETDTRYIINEVFENGTESDKAPNGEADNGQGNGLYTLKMDGQVLPSVTVVQGETKAAPFVDNFANNNAGDWVYAPVVETFGTNGMYNTYGAPLKSTVSGTLEVVGGTPEMSKYTWYDKGEWCSYYNIPLKFTALNIPEGYELYKVRAWRQVDNYENVLREEMSERKDRISADYLYEDMNYGTNMNGKGLLMSKATLQPDGGYLLGSRPVPVGETNVDATGIAHEVENETTATFGARRLKITDNSQSYGREGTLEELKAHFVVRAYFTRAENPAVKAQGSSNAPRHAEGTLTPADYDYYVAEGECDVTIKATEGIVTGISTPVQDRSCDVVGVTYVNPMGQTSSRPFGGVNIIVTRYSDGTTKTTKAVY